MEPKKAEELVTEAEEGALLDQDKILTAVARVKGMTRAICRSEEKKRAARRRMRCGLHRFGPRKPPPHSGQ